MAHLPLTCYPTFDDVFEPVSRRKKFENKADPNVDINKGRLLHRFKRMRRRRKHCSNKQCIASVLKPCFTKKTVQWLRAWNMTPRRFRQQALYNHMRSSKSVRSAMSETPLDEAGFTEKDGRKHLVVSNTKLARVQFSFLGHDVCSRSFRVLTGLGGLERYNRQLSIGFQSF